MCFLISVAIILYISYRLYQHFFPTPNIHPNGKYVLISGCDTGFGHQLAIELDKQGFNVLAGVLIPDNITLLQNKLSTKATVFRLDITKQEDIDAAFKLTNNKTKTLHALVNNAGIAAGLYIDWTPLEVMLAKHDSRVINICSVAGYLSMSNMSSYCTSKYALESFSDCLRREMSPWNLRVSIIEPGFMRTPIIQGNPKLL
ncbi:unnamed protein product [Rotaria sp. Silwood2]|nr:unnamed protein product [Rotaria sp. Silwood2]CAF3197192.1 unnamed protein product [Rotaria sp. Silwood2]CAF3493713.1 unnamed protein product [Rotaria sp. Silwood2]CAF3949933.1 unnamed protein product [Rotaria sp. Silwood2]CAF4567231.1 unnamed protein product [Rotaria sp. Silwood2]